MLSIVCDICRGQKIIEVREHEAGVVIVQCYECGGTGYKTITAIRQQRQQQTEEPDQWQS